MKKKSLIETIGIIIVMFVWFWIIWIMRKFISHPALVLLLPSAVWIYLVFMIWKKKTKIFHAQMEPELAERRYKRLKTFLLVAGILFAMVWLSALLMTYVTGRGVIDNVLFLIMFFSAVLFFIATIGSLVIFLKGRLKTT